MPLRFEAMTTPGWVRIIDLDDIQIHLSPGEALEFLYWLEAHRDELLNAARADGHSAGGASVPISATAEDVPEVDHEQVSGEGDHLDVV